MNTAVWTNRFINYLTCVRPAVENITNGLTEEKPKAVAVMTAKT